MLQYPRTVEDTSGGRGEARCMFCYEPFAHCATDCPWLGLQDAFDAAADAPPEVTEEMVEAMEREHERVCTGQLPRGRAAQILRAALATAQPDTPHEEG